MVDSFSEITSTRSEGTQQKNKMIKIPQKFHVVCLRQHPLQAHTVNPTHVFCWIVTPLLLNHQPPPTVSSEHLETNCPGLFGDNKCLTKSLATGEGLPRNWKSPQGSISERSAQGPDGPWLMGWSFFYRIRMISYNFSKDLGAGCVGFLHTPTHTSTCLGPGTPYKFALFLWMVNWIHPGRKQTGSIQKWWWYWTSVSTPWATKKWKLLFFLVRGAAYIGN